MVQLLWKVGATELNVALLALVALLFAGQLWNWLRVLAISDLSYSQPITSLSFITVLAFSALYLDERLDAAKLAGIVLVTGGVWLISRGPHRSAP